MATGKALNGKPYAGNPHVRFDEGEVASAATSRRGSLLYNQKTTQNYVKLEEAFPNVDVSAFDWIEDKICLYIQKDEEKCLYCQFCGRYIKLILKDGCVLKAAELDKFKDVLEQQIGYKTDCTGTPEKCGEPCIVYRVVDEMPLLLYYKLQSELGKLKAQYGKQTA